MTKNERLESVLGGLKNKNIKKYTCKMYCKYMWIDKYIYLLYDNSFEKFSKSSALSIQN